MEDETKASWQRTTFQQANSHFQKLEELARKFSHIDPFDSSISEMEIEEAATRAFNSAACIIDLLAGWALNYKVEKILRNRWQGKALASKRANILTHEQAFEEEPDVVREILQFLVGRNLWGMTLFDFAQNTAIALEGLSHQQQSKAFRAKGEGNKKAPYTKLQLKLKALEHVNFYHGYPCPLTGPRNVCTI